MRLKIAMLRQVKAYINCCAAVLGSTFLSFAVRLIVTLMLRASSTTASVFVLSVVLRGLSSPLHSCAFSLCSFFFTLQSVVERSDLKIFFEDYPWKQNLSRWALKIVVMTREQGTGKRFWATLLFVTYVGFFSVHLLSLNFNSRI